VAKSYSTARVARAARLRYWSDLLSNLVAPLEIKARERSAFDAAACAADFGPLHFVKIDSAPATVEHQAHHAAQMRERRFRIVLPLRGKILLRHLGHEAVLDEGDFALLDDSVPYRIEFHEPNRALCVAISPATIKAYLPAPTRLCGLRMPTDRPLNKVVSTMLAGLWKEIETEELKAEQRPALARCFLQVLAASYALDHTRAIDGSVVVAARRVEIKQYIETHLRSPELTPRTISAALGVSGRYVRLLFAAENDSVTAYLRRRRLEECAFELAQPEWRGRSITATASDWGFRSVTHFARAFKTVYGATPSAYKQAHRHGQSGQAAE
jgi:AraC-like DNA-binding protein